MEERANKNAAPDGVHMTAVRQWPATGPGGLRGEAKWAWRYIFYQCGCRVNTRHVVHAASLGLDQGTDDRAGRRMLASLARAGLIVIIERHGGRYTVDLLDPLEVARARLVSAGNDGQGELEFPEELKSRPEEAGSGEGEIVPLHRASSGHDPPSVPADVVQQPPAEVAQQPPERHLDTLSARARIETQYTLNTKDSVSVLCQNGGSGATSAGTSAGNFRFSGNPEKGDKSEEWWRRQLAKRSGRPAEVGAIGAALGDVLARLPSEEETELRVARLAAWLQAEVNDPETLPQTYRRIARAVQEGLYPRAKLDGLLIKLRQMKAVNGIKTTPGRYFLGQIKRQFHAVGIDWRGQA